MKIAIIKENIPCPYANVINTLKLAQGFYNLGHKVEILAITRLLEDIWRQKIKDVHNFYDINYNINIRYFRGSFFFYFNKSKFIRAIIKFLKLFPKLVDFLDPEIKASKYCIKNKIDFVICREPFRAAFNNIVNKIPTVIDIHGNIFPLGLKNLLKLKKTKYFKGIITLNDILKQEFIKKGFPKEKIFAMDNAINLDKFDKITNNKIRIRKKLNLPLKKKIILYVGTIEKEREIDTILNTAKILNDEAISFHFLGGNRKVIKKWENYIVHNKIKADINFLGLKSRKIIPFYLKAADILLATYSSTCSEIEIRSPLKLFEYMASKTPIIASKIGRLPEICNNDECLFTTPEDASDLSEKIKILLKNEELIQNLIKNAYAKAKNQTLKERCGKILEFIK